MDLNWLNEEIQPMHFSLLSISFFLSTNCTSLDCTFLDESWEIVPREKVVYESEVFDVSYTEEYAHLHELVDYFLVKLKSKMWMDKSLEMRIERVRLGLRSESKIKLLETDSDEDVEIILDRDFDKKDSKSDEICGENSSTKLIKTKEDESKAQMKDLSILKVEERCEMIKLNEKRLFDFHEKTLEKYKKLLMCLNGICAKKIGATKYKKIVTTFQSTHSVIRTLVDYYTECVNRQHLRCYNFTKLNIQHIDFKLYKLINDYREFKENKTKKIFYIATIYNYFENQTERFTRIWR